MKILGIDTSNQVMTVALAENSRLIAEKTVNVKRNHSIQLMPAIEELFKEAEWLPKDLDRIAVAKGPGSYTGVRIGVTVAKTLAFSLSCDIVGISSLQVLAGNGECIPGSYIVPVFDARRGNIFTGLYQVKGNKIVQVKKDTHISVSDWAEGLKQLAAPLQLLGEDVEKHSETVKEVLSDALIELPMSRQYTRASILTEMALDLEPESVHTFEPNYIRLAEAEQKWMEANPELTQGGGWIEKL